MWSPLQPSEGTVVAVRHAEGIVEGTTGWYRRAWTLLAGAALLVLAILLVRWLVVALVNVLLLLAFAIVLATGLDPLVEKVARLGPPRVLAILVIYLVGLVGLGLLGLIVVPRVVSELLQLADILPWVAGPAQALSERLQPVPLLPPVTQINPTQAQILRAAHALIGVLAAVVGGITSLILVLALTFLLLLQGAHIVDRLIALLPPTQRQRARHITREMSRKVSGWLQGVVIVALVQGALATIGLLIIGMPFPFILGLIAGIFEFIPVVGAWLSFGPALLIALTQPTSVLVTVVGFYVALSLFENYVLTPKVMSQAAELPPFWVLLAVFVGAQLFGILGALLATPVALALQVLWLEVLVPQIRQTYREC